MLPTRSTFQPHVQLSLTASLSLVSNERFNHPDYIYWCIFFSKIPIDDHVQTVFTSSSVYHVVYLCSLSGLIPVHLKWIGCYRTLYNLPKGNCILSENTEISFTCSQEENMADKTKLNRTNKFTSHSLYSDSHGICLIWKQMQVYGYIEEVLYSISWLYSTLDTRLQVDHLREFNVLLVLQISFIVAEICLYATAMKPNSKHFGGCIPYVNDVNIFYDRKKIMAFPEQNCSTST